MEKRLDWRWGVWGADDRAWLTSLHVRNKKLLHIDQTNACQQSTIPKIVHQIWLGPHPIPRQCIQWMKSWKTIHSDFEYRLWRDADVGTSIHLKNEKAFQEASNWGEKSDILRYEILLQFGGLYVDVDMECIQSFNSLLTRLSFVVGISNTACVEINNGVIASIPNHPILERIIDTIYRKTHQPQLNPAMVDLIAQMSGSDVKTHLNRALVRSSNTTAMSTIERTGPGLLTRVFMDAIDWEPTSSVTPNDIQRGFLSPTEQNLVAALPVNYFYPLPNSIVETRKRAPSQLPIETMAVHYWERTWIQN